MNSRNPAQRGAALLLALLVVVMATLLVAGAISFTASERQAAVAQTRDDRLSACVQSARNTFLSRLRLLEGNVMTVQLADVALNPTASAGDDTMSVSTRHYTLGSDAGVALAEIKSVTRLPDNVVGATNSGVGDLSNRVGRSAILAGFYSITVLCQERAGGPEREVEFTVRVGF